VSAVLAYEGLIIPDGWTFELLSRGPEYWLLRTALVDNAVKHLREVPR
jgi:hypothetical protein